MSIQVINIGTTANDGTGDPIRNAFSKINTNFEYISDNLPTALNSNITISDITISSDLPNDSIIIAPDGTGILNVESGAWLNSEQRTSNTRISTVGQLSMVHVDSVNNKVGINTSSLSSTSNTFTVNGTANISGNTYISNLSISGEIFSNLNINGEIYAYGGNIISDAGILHLANNKTATQAINNVFIHFAEANIGGIEYKFGVTSVPLEFGNPANVVIVLGSDVPLTTPNIYTGQTIIGNSATFAGTFIDPQVIGSYSQSFSDPDFTIFTPGKGRTFIVSNLVLNTRTVSNSIGSSGDVAGMVSVNGTNVYVCTGTYDGSTAIWKYASLTSF